MTSKFPVLLAAVAVLAIGVLPATAQQTQMKYDKNGRVYYGPGGPNRVVQQGNTRVYITTRSWLDAGTEVQPGERKFLDYAFPPTHTTMGVVTNTGGRVGWHNSPLPGPFFPSRN